jgi:hypothetical protein
MRLTSSNPPFRTKTLLSGVPHPKGSLHWLAFSQADRMTGTPIAPFQLWLPTELYDCPIATTAREKKDWYSHLTSVATGKLSPSRPLARNNLRSSGHNRQKDPRGYLCPTDITNSLVSENSVIDHFDESNRPDLPLPRGLENRFQEAAVFI